MAAPAQVGRALRPLRSCSSSSSLFVLANHPQRRSVTYSRPAATSKTAPARAAYTPTTTTRAAPTPARPVATRSTPTRTTPAPKPAAAPPPDAAAAEPPLDPERLVLDPQAAIPPAEKATLASSFATVAEPSPLASSLSSLAAAASNGGATPGSDVTIDWSDSYHGLAQTPFSPEAAAILMAPIEPDDVEVKPDGILYLPEIKYRRILNRAFGPGGWGLAPRGELIVGDKVVTREYALVAHGRFVAQARGECSYFGDETIPTAGEGSKSNALMRCCKDLGVASELWDPRFIRKFKKEYAREIWVEHVVNKKKRQIWVRKDTDPTYPYKKSA